MHAYWARFRRRFRGFTSFWGGGTHDGVLRAGYGLLSRRCCRSLMRMWALVRGGALVSAVGGGVFAAGVGRGKGAYFERSGKGGVGVGRGVRTRVGPLGLGELRWRGWCCMVPPPWASAHGYWLAPLRGSTLFGGGTHDCALWAGHGLFSRRCCRSSMRMRALARGGALASAVGAACFQRGVGRGKGRILNGGEKGVWELGGACERVSARWASGN
jgi:hypothetical protein